MRYVPLHVHSEYSLLDGAIRNKDLIKFAKENNFEAVAVTDHGVMYGAIELYRQGKENQFKVLLGCEFYIYHGDIKSHDSNNRELYHLVLIAKNNTGYQNLVKLVSIAHIDGFYYKPRINREILEEHCEGLICLSACIQGEVVQEILNGNREGAKNTAKYYKNLFKDDYYIELQDHGLAEQKRSNPELIKIAQELDIPMVITNDSHYLRKEDSTWHDTLLCIQTNAFKDDEKRMRFDNSEFYVKTPEELRDAFRWMDADLFEEAIENTARIADKCHVIIKMGENILPSFEVPKGHSIPSYLDFLVRKGLDERYDEITPEIEKRYKYELEIINKMGFDAYFLIVWDFINYAKKHGIPVGPGRGSAAGSLVAYSLGITDLDPIRHNLLFERFLNPERVSMPDVDIDFGDGRERVIDYVTEKYGSDKVCQIITFGTLSAKAAIKAVARVNKIPFETSNRVSQLVPSEVDMTISKALEESPDFKKEYEESAVLREIIDEAMKIEGLKQNTGMHAAGVIIAHQPLDEICPVQRAKEGNIITEYPKEDCEKIGLLKMDFLGLKNLTIIQKTVELVKELKGIDIEINKIPLDDSEVYKMLMKGETDGVFQLESTGMKKLVRDLKPSVFEDLGALVALFRPGPLESGMITDFVKRKHGEQEIKYAHPLLENILKDTYGTIVYQEQIMQIFQVLADYTLGEADMVRRMMGKKKFEEMAKQKTRFVEASIKKGMTEEGAKELFDQIESFAKYCFNRSHSAAYAYVAYQTAYLKVHYPVEYICAMLSNSKDNLDKIQLYIAEAQRLGIKVFPPDINKSKSEFYTDGVNIRFGLNSIKGIGDAVQQEIADEKQRGGEFSSIADFARRINPRIINRKALENLAKAGAFLSLVSSRKQMFINIENILNVAGKEMEAREMGQVSLFSAMNPQNMGNSYHMQSFELFGTPEEFSDRELQEFEKDLMGFYLTCHPLESIRKNLPFLSTHKIEELKDIKNDTFVTICGLLTSVRKIPTKKDPNKFLKAGMIEDLTAEIPFVAFQKTLEQYNSLIETEKKVIVSGKYQNKDSGQPQIIIESIKPVENSNIVTISIEKEIAYEKLMALKDMLANYKGNDPLVFKSTENGEETKILASQNYWVNASNVLTNNVEKYFSQDVDITVNSLS